MTDYIGVLLIHGTFGSPMEYAAVEPLLQRKGYLTRAVSLPGHGALRHQSLKTMSAQAILDHSMAEYTALSEQCDAVLVIGHSLGGACALWLAGQNPDKLIGVVSFAAPFEHAYFVNRFSQLFCLSSETLIRGLCYFPQGMTGCDTPIFMPWWYARLYREAGQLFQLLRQGLPHIQVPVYLAHSVYDLVVPHREMSKIAERIGKPHLVTSHVLRRCGHQVFPKSREADFAMQLILHFIEQLEMQPMSCA